MKNFKIFMRITLLLFISVTLGIIPWIPSLLVESIVNSLIILLYIVSAFLVYKIILNSYKKEKEKKIYKNTIVAGLLLMYIGFFAILQISIALTKSSYLESYSFDTSILYVYKDDNNSYEISAKETNLPIRTVPIVKEIKGVIRLEKRDNYVYMVGKNVNKKVFDLKTKKPITKKD